MRDLISRNALNELLDELCVTDALYNAINNLPAVDAKPVVHAEWKFKVKSNGGYRTSITCSACGYPHSIATYNFCPECGADMRKEQL